MQAQGTQLISQKKDTVSLQAYIANNHIPVLLDPQSYADVANLAKDFGSAQVIGVGESSYGSGSQLAFRIKLFKYLIEHHQLRILIIEASFTETLALHDFVMYGLGDIQKVLNGLGYWNWDTEEMIVFARWLRSYNADRPLKDRVRIYGADMQFYLNSLKQSISYINKVDAPRASAFIQVMDSLYTMDEARQRLIQFSLHDAHKRNLLSLSSQLMQHLDQQRKTYIEMSNEHDWAMARQNAVVAAQAIRGILQDNEKWSRLGPVEERLLMARIPESVATIQAFLEQRDKKNVQVYASLFQFIKEPTEAFMHYRDKTSESVQASYIGQANALVELFSNEKASYRRVKKEDLARLYSAAKDIQLLFSVFEEKKLKPKRWPNERDKAMAQNVLWISQFYGQQKVMLWAHNSHLAVIEDEPGFETLGFTLKQRYGDGYLNLAQLFNRGSFLGMMYPAPKKNSGQSKLQTFAVQPAFPATYEAQFSRSGQFRFILPLKHIVFAEETYQMLRTRMLRGTFSPDNELGFYEVLRLSKTFDYVVFNERSEALTPSATLKRIYPPE